MTPKKKPETPLPCPWCKQETVSAESAMYDLFFVKCCGTGPCMAHGPYRKRRCSAIRAWNRVAKAAQKGKR